MTGDEAVELLIKWMRDEEVPYGVCAKIAQDIADRAGLAATQVHQIVPSTEDPVLRFLADIDPRDIVITQPPGPPQPALETRADDRPEDDAEPKQISEAEVVNEPEGDPADDSPPRIAEMIKVGAFDRKAGE